MSQPSLWERLRVPLAVCAALLVALVWALAHMRYTRPPAGVPYGKQFSSSPALARNLHNSAAPPRHTQPNHVYIPALGVRAPIIQAPPDGDVLLPLPLPPTNVGMYADGGKLASGPGTVLLAGHVVYNGAKGALWDLHKVRFGDDVWTTDARGHLTHWRIYADPVIDKHSATWPTSVYTARGPRRLVIVTCTGTPTHIPGHGYSFPDNQFAYATPVA